MGADDDLRYLSTGHSLVGYTPKVASGVLARTVSSSRKAGNEPQLYDSKQDGRTWQPTETPGSSGPSAVLLIYKYSRF